MSHGVPLMALAIALPTALLGVGWHLSSQREHAAYEREVDQRLMRAADSVRVAVDESLEELREREDRRPFYLYNHYYSPPEAEVKSVTDPVAISPLAREPQDARVIGYFQVDPEGVVRTPAVRDGEEPASPAIANLVSILASDAFGPLRDLRRAGDDASLLAALPPAPPPPVTRARRPRRRNAANMNAEASTMSAVASNMNADDLQLEGPLTVSLNRWGNAVFDEIEAAQQGDSLANLRVQQRGRTVPQTTRSARSWNEFGQPETTQQAPLPQQRVETPVQRRRLPPVEPSTPDCEPGATDPFACVPEGGALVRQREADVGYTSMAWRRVGDQLVLHRLVDHQGSVVVQGALFDRAQMRETWIPGVVSRLGSAVVGTQTLTPSIVQQSAEASCALRQPVSEVLALDLCFEAAAVARVIEIKRKSGVQLGLLVGLLAIVGFAVLLIVRAARRAEELSRQKSAFVSAVSHELRTPLTTIRMHAEMLQEDMVVPERRPKVYGELVQESMRLGRLVENVLELSRLEEGARVLRKADADLRAHVRELLESQRAFIERRDFTLDGPEAGPALRLSYDAQAIEQITLNLVDNALKYGRSEKASVEVAIGCDTNEAWIEVRDHGPGIPVASRSRIFERFFRIESEATKHMPGTGIGLTLVGELTQAHGGRVEVSDTPGGGCTVRVTLPR